MSVYVDDLLLSGPTQHHAQLWKRLRSGPDAIAMDEPESLDRFLGRTHRECVVNGVKTLAFDMKDYGVQAC